MVWKKNLNRGRVARRARTLSHLCTRGSRGRPGHDEEVAVAASRRVRRGDDLHAFGARETDAR